MKFKLIIFLFNGYYCECLLSDKCIIIIHMPVDIKFESMVMNYDIGNL